MTNETYLETKTNKVGYTWNTRVKVEYGPTCSPDFGTARWFQTLRGEISMVRPVTVTRTSIYTSGEMAPIVSEGYEVRFKCGARGWVDSAGSELDALVVDGKGYIHGLVVWKKHGSTRGKPVLWFMAQKSSPKKRMNVDRAPRSCAAELYARAAGKNW